MTLIQTNAAVSPGNSGGGLFNANGELIGIVNAKSDSTDAEGLGFAIPINTAVQVAQQLIDNGYVPRPALGVVVITISDQQTAMQYNVSDYGVYIAQVNDGSGAAEAGLQPGDRIVSIGDVVVFEQQRPDRLPAEPERGRHRYHSGGARRLFDELLTLPWAAPPPPSNTPAAPRHPGRSPK